MPCSSALCAWLVRLLCRVTVTPGMNQGCQGLLHVLAGHTVTIQAELRVQVVDPPQAALCQVGKSTATEKPSHFSSWTCWACSSHDHGLD